MLLLGHAMQQRVNSLAIGISNEKYGKREKSQNVDIGISLQLVVQCTRLKKPVSN